VGKGSSTCSVIKRLLGFYRRKVEIPANDAHCSVEDCKEAERKFLKYVLEQRSIEVNEERFGGQR
jgi:hypothetical protein